MSICFPHTRRTGIALAAAFFVLPATAQSPSSLSSVVVTANRTAQPIGELVADMSVIDRSAIERSGATGIADLLLRLPGIEMSRNGGPGATTNVYTRGTDTRHTAVYLDGVRIDSQSTGGAAWENIPLSQVDRIEVLRGPASAVYGSDAIGGVVQIFTRKGEGAFTPYASVGAGTYSSGRVQSGFSGSQEGFDYSLGLAREVSQGYNARPIAGQNTDDDGYQQTSANGRLGWQINRDQRIETTLLSNDMVSRYDSSGQSRDDRNIHRLLTAGVNWQARWTDAYSTKVSVTDSNSHYETAPSIYLTETRLRGYLWQNEWRHGPQLVTATAERKEDVLDNASTTPTTTSRAQNGVALGYGWSGTVHTWQAHVRNDQDSEFGSQGTGSLGYGYALTPLWRLTASAGSAFRAPTLYHRFSVYGVSTLKPESSRSYEVGARRSEGSSTWGVVAYRNFVENLITFSSPGPCASSTGCYANTAAAEYSGITLSAQEMVNQVRVRASFDLQDPRDAQTGKMLARRAQRYANLGADTQLGSWSVGGDARFSSQRYDDAANTVVLPGYSLYSLYAQTRLSSDWSMVVKLDNATQADYQLANSYATAGRSIFVTFKWEPASRPQP